MPKIMKNIDFKKLTITFILSFFVLFAYGDKIYGTFEGNTDQLVFKPEMTAEEMAELYHKTMNDLFNKKAKLLVTGKPEEIDENIPEDGEKAALIKKCQAHPTAEECEGIDSTIENCKQNPDKDECKLSYQQCLSKKNNVTTFCIAMEASYLYIKFKDALLSKWDEVEFDPEKTLTQMLQAIRTQRLFISGQIDSSKKVLDNTLNAYNELRWSFAMHREYKKVIKDLLKYRDKIADVRKYVEQYPDKFHDSSTPYCE